MSWVHIAKRWKIILTRKVGFEGTPKLDPYWKSQPVTCKVNTEWKFELNLWTKTILTRGSEFLMAWTNWSQTWSARSTTTTSRKPLQRRLEEFAVKTEVFAFASRSQAKAKQRTSTSACSSTRTVPIGERTWTDIEPEDYSPIAYPVSTQLSTLLRHGEPPREEDGAIETERPSKQIGLTMYGRARWQEAEATRKKSILYWSVRTRNSVSPSSSRSFRTHFHWSCTSGQCVNSERFLQEFFHIGCAINLHSIMNWGFIPGGQILSKSQTVFFTSVNPMNKNHRDPYKLGLTQPRLVWYPQKAWKKHQNTVYWVDIKLAQKKLSSIKHDRTQSSFTTHSQLFLYPEGYHDGNWINQIRESM